MDLTQWMCRKWKLMLWNFCFVCACLICWYNDFHYYFIFCYDVWGKIGIAKHATYFFESIIFSLYFKLKVEKLINKIEILIVIYWMPKIMIFWMLLSLNNEHLSRMNAENSIILYIVRFEKKLVCISGRLILDDFFFAWNLFLL